MANDSRGEQVRVDESANHDTTPPATNAGVAERSTHTDDDIRSSSCSRSRQRHNRDPRSNPTMYVNYGKCRPITFSGFDMLF